MFLATGCSAGSNEVSLWDVSDVPVCVATQSLSCVERIECLAISRDGLLLAVATASIVEIWRLPCMTFLHRSHYDMCRTVITRHVKFNHGGDKYVTVTNGWLRVWSVIDGTCEREIAVAGAEPYFLTDDDEVAFLYRRKEVDGEYSVVIDVYSISSGDRTSAVITSSVYVGPGALARTWAMSVTCIAIEDSLIVAYMSVDEADHLGRWDTQNKCFRWKNRSDFSNNLTVSFDGTLVAVCSIGRSVISIDLLCAASGNRLRNLEAPVCGEICRPWFAFSPCNSDVILFGWPLIEENGASGMFGSLDLLRAEATWQIKLPGPPKFAVQPWIPMLLL
jgi:WD40 repeat protein